MTTITREQAKALELTISYRGFRTAVNTAIRDLAMTEIDAIKLIRKLHDMTGEVGGEYRSINEMLDAFMVQQA